MSDMMEPGRGITAETRPSSSSAKNLSPAELEEANRRLLEQRAQIQQERAAHAPPPPASLSRITPRPREWTPPDLSQYTCQKCRDSGYVGARWDDLTCQCERGLAEGKIQAAKREEAFMRQEEAKAEWMREQRQKLLERLDPAYKGWDKDNYPVQGNQKAFQMVLEYISSGEYERQGLGLSGPVGTGKTSLAVTAFKLVAPLLMDFPHVGAGSLHFVSVLQMFDDWRASFDEDRRTDEPRYPQLFKRLATARLLVLDDLGAERPTDWTKEQLNKLIDARARADLPTWFTTNCSLKELEQIISARCYSRLVYRAHMIEITGVDLRKECRKKGGA